MASPTSYAPGIPQKSLSRYPILLPSLGHDGVPGRLGLTASMSGEGNAEVLRYVGRLVVPDIGLECHVLPATKPPHQAARNTIMVPLGSVDNIYWVRRRGNGSCTRANVLSVTRNRESEAEERKSAVGCRPLFPPGRQDVSTRTKLRIVGVFTLLDWPSSATGTRWHFAFPLFFLEEREGLG